MLRVFLASVSRLEVVWLVLLLVREHLPLKRQLRGGYVVVHCVENEGTIKHLADEENQSATWLLPL